MHVARRNRALFNFGDRLAGFAIEHEDHALLAGLYQYRRGAAFTVWQIVQQRLRRQVEVPQVVVCGLIVPADFTGCSVNGDDGGTVFIVQRGTFTGPEIRSGVTGWQINEIQFRVIGHRRPDVRRTAGVGLAFRRQARQIRVTWIPGPGQLAATYVVRANHARRFIGGEVIRDSATHHHHITRDQRCGGLLIVTRFDFAHTDAQVHNTVVAKVFAQLAVIGVDGDQARIGGWQEQAARTGGWLRCALRRVQHLRIFKVAQTTAALPVRRGGFRIIAPLLFTGIDIQRQYFAIRCTDKQGIAYLQRRVLIFRT